MRESVKAVLFVGAWVASLLGLAAAGGFLVPHSDAGWTARGMTLVVRGEAWSLTYHADSPNATAFRLLREASVVMRFELHWVDYGWPYYDVFVTSINGTRSDQARDLWWQYCVDGAYASVGAANQEVRDGGVVAWVYAHPGGAELCR